MACPCPHCAAEELVPAPPCVCLHCLARRAALAGPRDNVIVPKWLRDDPSEPGVASVPPATVRSVRAPAPSADRWA